MLVLAEVNNTFGGRHTYWLTPRSPAATIRCFAPAAAKTLYVSPFMPIAADYEFVLTPPGETLVAHMNVDRAQTRASGRASRRDAVARHPPVDRGGDSLGARAFSR